MMEIKHIINNDLLNMKLTDMRCKHALPETAKGNEVIRLSKEIGYEWAKWGAHSNHNNVAYHADVVMKMEFDMFEHPERIVVCDYPFSNEKHVWIDNMHSAVMYVRKYGLDVKLSDIPFYVVDISGGNEIVADNGTGIVIPNKASGAVISARKRQAWSCSEELIALNYTLKDLLEENPVLLYCREFFGTEGAYRGPKKELDVK